MKYLCLIYVDEKRLEAAGAETIVAVQEECRTQTEELAGQSRFIAGEKLQPSDTATMVRNRDGGVAVTDGPFAETKEQIGGFYLIEAPDLDEAIRIASRIPPGRFGCIEVRPVDSVPQT